MKKFIEATWVSKQMDTLGSLFNSVLGAASPSGLSDVKDHEMIFEFLNLSVELKGYKETYKRFEDFNLTHFIDEIKAPKDGTGPMEDFFRGLIKEDPVFAKDIIVKGNGISRKSYPFITDALIKINEIFLEETKDNPSYLWEAQETVLTHFRNKNILTDDTKPDAYKTYKSLVDKSNRTLSDLLSLKVASDVHAFVFNFKDEIIQKILETPAFDKNSSKYLHTILKYTENSKIQDLAYEIDKEYINDNWRNSREKDYWIYRDEKILFDVFKNYYNKEVNKEVVEGERRYLSSAFNEINKTPTVFTIEGANNFIYEYNQGLIKVAVDYSDVFTPKENFVNSIYEKMEKRLSSNIDSVSKDINDILESSQAKTYFLNYDDGVNLPSKHYNKMLEEHFIKAHSHLKNNVDKSSLGQMVRFLAISELVEIKLENKEELERIKEVAINKFVDTHKNDRNNGSFSASDAIKYLSVLYRYDKENRISPLLNSGAIWLSSINSNEVLVPKKTTNKNTGKNTFSFSKPSDIATPENEYRKRLLDIVLFDENLKEKIKEVNRSIPKNMIMGFAEELKDLVSENPAKYYPVIMENKTISKVVSELPESISTEIFAKMISVKIDKTKKNSPQDEVPDTNSSFKI